ncbi:MAG: succinate dehydrogenase iron-sulfur subunit [Gemmatimonadota bacterium]|nr:succinate dehydrogenase iron-sulfur subunit [Gemmatimonadota bacterium]
MSETATARKLDERVETGSSTSKMDFEIPEPGTRAREAEGNIRLRVRRQDGPERPSYWEAFEIPRYPNMNVVECLMEIRKNPVDAEGRETTPVAWMGSCLEEVCGICTMLVNGTVRQSCSALVDDFEEPITLEPMQKFPVQRDLVVNRERLFDDYRRVEAWVPIDGTYPVGPGPRMDERVRKEGYWLSRCISCGCCVDACPQVNPESDRETFVGAAPISWARLMNMHPTGESLSDERYAALMGPGGISDCAKSMNCVEVCPKEIPLMESIAAMNRQITRHLLVDWLKD